MYTPKHFRADELAHMHALIRGHNFGILVTQGADGAPFATHLPFLLDERGGSNGALLAHVARANPQWRDLAAGQEALAIFQGPHAYVTPSWYSSGPNVPTWNYSAVHAYGRARIVDDPAELRGMLGALVDYHESSFEQPWHMNLPDDYMERMMRGVVGFEIEITRLEGKLKLSQNRNAEDRQRVTEALAESDDRLSAATGALMREMKIDAA
jgi:transcriptional regulator